MASLQARLVRGHRYWYIVESRRVQGKPRPIVLAYLGKAEQLLTRLQNPRPDLLTFKSFSHGAVAALLALVQRLELIPLINQQVPPRPSQAKQLREGLTVGASVVLRILERICGPCSNRAFAAWAKTTSLEYLLRTPLAQLDSQPFWDQMNALPVAALATIEKQVLARWLHSCPIALDTLLLDATHFFTFIDTTNTHCPLAQRGKNKQGHNNLRQVGLLLLVTRREVLPWFHETYAGNKADSNVFADAIGRITARLEDGGCDLSTVTLVFDRGNNSKKNLSPETRKLHYVGALVAAQHKELVEQACAHLATQAVPAETVVPVC